MAEGLFSITHCLQYDGRAGSHLKVSSRPVSQNCCCQISLVRWDFLLSKVVSPSL